jgi:heat shock protein HslJ
MRIRAAAAVLAVLVVTGCSTTQPGAGTPTDESLDGEWALTQGSDATGTFDLKDSLATLVLTGGNPGGRTPCNAFGATVDGGVGEIDITPTFQTEAACADPDLMALEPRYLDALDAVTEAAVTSGGLSLTGPNVSLTFELAPEVPTSKLTGTDWRLESIIDGETVSSVLGDGLLKLRDDGTLIGNAGCRDFTGTWKVDAGVVSVSDLEFAAADCPAEFVSQEEAVDGLFSDPFSAEVTGDQLTLTAEDGALGLVFRDDASEQA